MKRILTICIVIMFFCISCSNTGTKDPVDMDEILKISTWLLDKELEGTGRWGYIDSATREYPHVVDGDGYWIPDDGITEVKNEDVFVYESLEAGVPRTMAPMTMCIFKDGELINYNNLNIFVDFDGIVEVETKNPADSSLRLSYRLNGSMITESNSIRTSAPVNINVCPVGKETSVEATEILIARDTVVGKEYTIYIRAYELDGTLAVAAELKLISIPDPEYPWQTAHKGRYGELYSANEERTRFCSIELVSYTYSEMHILRGEAFERGE